MNSEQLESFTDEQMDSIEDAEARYEERQRLEESGDTDEERMAGGADPDELMAAGLLADGYDGLGEDEEDGEPEASGYGEGDSEIQFSVDPSEF